MKFAQRLLRRGFDLLRVGASAGANEIAPLLQLCGDELAHVLRPAGWRVTLIAWSDRTPTGHGSCAFAFGATFPTDVEAQRVTAVSMLRFAADSLEGPRAHERAKT